MKTKKPIFTYIMTVLNSFFTMFVVSLFGSCFVMAANLETGDAFTFIDLYYPSIEFGFLFCIGISLLYFLLIRTKKFRPRWWSNILFILISYLSTPFHAFCTSLLREMTLKHEDIARVGSNTFEAFLLAVIGFIVVAQCTRKKKKSAEDNRKSKLQSPLWIAAFAFLQYITFFMTLVFSSILISLKFVLSANLLLKFNHLLQLPFYSSMTRDFVSLYMPGKLAHIVFMANAVVWGVAIWQALKHFQNRPHAETQE